MTPLDLNPESMLTVKSLVPTGINDSGTICGFLIDTSNAMHSFIASGETSFFLTTVDPPSGYTSLKFTGAGLGVNCVGVAVDTAGVNHGYLTQSFTNGFVTSYMIVTAPDRSSQPSMFPAGNGINGTLLNGENLHGIMVGSFSDGTKLHGMIALPQ